MSDLLMACRTCGSQCQHEFLRATDLNQEKSSEEFTYYRCDDCESIFLHPVPKNLGSYYDQDYPAYTVKNSHKTQSKVEYLERAKLNIVQEFASSGKLVEIGTAAGGFLSVASQAGYDVLGIEQDVGCVAYIRNVLKLDVKNNNNPINELLQLTSCCDVIVAWHVIEHLPDLRGFVSAASKALREPNGVIILSVPNPEALSFKIFGRYWVHLDAPRHLTLPPPQALHALMAEYGLEKVDCIFNDPVGLFLNKMGWQWSMKNLSRNKRLRWPLLSGLGKALSIAMWLFDRKEGKGAAYTVIYKKKHSVK